MSVDISVSEESRLLNYLDQPPNTLLGCNDEELVKIILFSIPVNLPVFAIISMLLGLSPVYGMAFSLLPASITAWFVARQIGGKKVGKPAGWVSCKISLWLNKYLGVRPWFETYSGKWTQNRELKRR